MWAVAVPAMKAIPLVGRLLRGLLLSLRGSPLFFPREGRWPRLGTLLRFFEAFPAFHSFVDLRVGMGCHRHFAEEGALASVN